MKPEQSVSIVFLSTNNTLRSQFAEALLRAKSDINISVASAGISTGIINDLTIEVMQAHHLSTQSFSSNTIEEIAIKHFDYAINLSPEHDQTFRAQINCTQFLSWDIQAISDDLKGQQRYQQLQQRLLQLSSRMDMLLSTLDEKSDATLETTPFDSIAFYKSMSDSIRLNTLMLTHFHGELCVCELMQALQEESQPKVSRNLAVLKKANILSSNKIGQWVYYRINPHLPEWAKTVIAQTTEHNLAMIIKPIQTLAKMKNRPNKNNLCKL